MTHYNYLIIGGGMTADAAIKGIREVDEAGRIGLISRESHPPYNRPPLSKGLWKGSDEAKIWRGTADRGVDLHLNSDVTVLQAANEKRVADTAGHSHTFDALLLATGGRPRRLPFGGENILYYRTYDDYRKLRALAGQQQRFAVIGGGFIGSEIAAALAMNGQDVVMLFPERGIGARVLPQDLSDSLNSYYREHKIDVLAGSEVTGLVMQGDKPVLQLRASGESPAALEVDAVVAGIGIVPNAELAEAAGLEVDNGVVVDAFLRSSDPAVYAAGDVAAFYNPALDKRIRVEHEDNANSMGRLAGRNMAGESQPYNSLPFFYSDLFDLGYEAVGLLDSRLQTVSDWQEPFRKGVIYYLDEGRVRGVLLWNVWDQVDAARDLISQPGPFSASDLKGHISG